MRRAVWPRAAASWPVLIRASGSRMVVSWEASRRGLGLGVAALVYGSRFGGLDRRTVSTGATGRDHRACRTLGDRRRSSPQRNAKMTPASALTTTTRTG